jgi:hypothetical protein
MELSALGELVAVTFTPLVAEKVWKLVGIEVSSLEVVLALLCVVVTVRVLVRVMVLRELELSEIAKVLAGPDL